MQSVLTNRVPEYGSCQMLSHSKFQIVYFTAEK